jgi:hypothetical protein
MPNRNRPELKATSVSDFQETRSAFWLLPNKLKHPSPNLRHATVCNPQTARSAERKVEDTAANPGSPVRDTNYHRLRLVQTKARRSAETPRWSRRARR